MKLNNVQDNSAFEVVKNPVTKKKKEKRPAVHTILNFKRENTGIKLGLKILFVSMQTYLMNFCFFGFLQILSVVLIIMVQPT